MPALTASLSLSIREAYVPGGAPTWDHNLDSRPGIRGWKITADDVLPYTPRSTLECILMGMGTTPEVELQKRTYYGRRLISGFLRFLYELAKQQITITKFHATSVTPTGIAILRNAGFKETGQIGKRRAFELDVMTSDAPLAEQYREVLGVQRDTGT